ncbi:hypothetical protein [Desulfomicrobium escambiense]|uniref:hypothetical protein n=1 Tax=Desulfomicrobium escambiense TaxID=29503 RepID=UPI00041BDF90|nr:hypothetical protein [Desulfomicrobium escambiense]
MNTKDVFGKDRIAAALAAGTILLLFVFFYALHQNVAGLGREIEELKRLNGAVLELDARHAVLDGKVTELATLPRRTSAMAMENQVKAMAHAAEDLDRRLDGRQRERLAAVRALLQEIGEDLHETK